MGKKTQKYPEFTNGTVSVNGKTKATAKKIGDNIKTNYKMSKFEKNMFNSIENGMANGLTNLFEISDNERKQWGEQLNAMKKQGIENINSIYTPMENNLKNDIASRFGNFDNSVFLDKLSAITDNKAKAVAELSNNINLSQNNLYNEELQNRINTLSFLNGLNTSLNNNILNYTNAATANASIGNNYNNNAYNAAKKSSSFLDNILGTASNITSTLAAFI